MMNPWLQPVALRAAAAAWRFIITKRTRDVIPMKVGITSNGLSLILLEIPDQARDDALT